MNKKTTLTRKIEIVPIGESKEARSETWKRVIQLSKDCVELSNKIVARHYLTFCEGLKYVNPDLKNISGKELREYITEKYGFKLQNLGYDLSKQYKESIPSYVRGAINNQIFSLFKKEIFDVHIGKKSIRTYKQGSPMPTYKTALLFNQLDDAIFLTWCKMDFILAFGRDKSNNKEIVKCVLDGVYNLCDSQIQYDKRRNKIFLLLTYSQDVKDRSFDKGLCVGVDLGINAPAYVALNDGFSRKQIGDREFLLNPRLRIQARRRQLQKQLQFTKGGRGRKKKLQALEKLRTTERNTVKTINHKISKSVIDFAIKHNAGVVKLEQLAGIAQDEKSKWLLRNWSYYELQSFIEYKAKKVGIEVIYVKAAYTSQTCPCCGVANKENRKTQAEFTCVNLECSEVGILKNADYIGALNISRSEKLTTRSKSKKAKKKAVKAA